MRIVDLNILLYIVNQDSPHHTAVRAWWERILADDDTVGLPWLVLLGFLRIATNPSAFSRPLAVPAALGRIDAWLGLENVHVAREGDRHWEILRRLLSASGSAGNLTTDAHLAALAIGLDATLASCDADFGRFRGLRWENPLG